MRTAFAAALMALAAGRADAHRPDEYLQATLVSLEDGRLDAGMTLTPGVAVFPFVMAAIDTDGDGAISEAEQRAYAERVLSDLTLKVDGMPVKPRLLSSQFPSADAMKEGLGEIRLRFSADLPAGGGDRKVTVENRHLPQISVYQVNCLVSGDPKMRIVAQTRNYTQSVYALEYLRTGAEPVPALSSGGFLWLYPIGFLLLARLVFLHRGTRSAASRAV
jgi:hypothetical protein